MAEALFYFLALIALVAGANVILQRNPVVCVVNLVLVFFALSGIYVILGFPLVAAVQLLVYTGAILVLFLFVILLLNLKREEKRPPALRWILGWICTVGFGVLALGLSMRFLGDKTLESPEKSFDSAELLGKELFTNYMIPFEATGILLLAAIVGVLWLGAKQKAKESTT